MKYPQKLLNFFHDRKHGGEIAQGSEYLRTSLVGHENQEILVLYVIYEEKVLRAQFQAFGSVELLAAAEFICTWLEDKNETQIRNLNTQMILQTLELGNLKVHIANLVLKAVQQLFP